jgi:leader peptidase (prepilin peptidase) / N-methyltransferase
VMVNILLFIFGAVMGSAANALIDRLPRKESWIKGKSHCDKCRHILRWYDLVPVASYLTLEGKCRYCHSPIPTRNLFTELFMGISFVTIFNFQFLIFKQYQIFQLFNLLMIFWVTVIIAVMDWETKLVSEVMVGVWGLLVIGYWLLAGSYNFQDNIWGLILSLGVIGGIWALSRGKAMGFGDVEIAAVMGWWLGAVNTGIALWAAFILGSAVGIYKLIKKTTTLKSEIAFGPFLIMGAWIAYYGGKYIWQYLIY